MLPSRRSNANSLILVSYYKGLSALPFLFLSLLLLLPLLYFLSFFSVSFFRQRSPLSLSLSHNVTPGRHGMGIGTV